MLVVGLGAGETLLRYPRVQQAMAWGGVLWLSGLAWQIFRSAPPSLDPTDTQEEGFSVLGAAMLQLVNPKVWMMAMAVVSVFVGGGDKTLRLLVLSLAFLLVSLPCMTLWALLRGQRAIDGVAQGVQADEHGTGVVVAALGMADSLGVTPLHQGEVACRYSRGVKPVDALNWRVKAL